MCNKLVKVISVRGICGTDKRIIAYLYVYLKISEKGTLVLCFQGNNVFFPANVGLFVSVGAT